VKVDTHKRHTWDAWWDFNVGLFACSGIVTFSHGICIYLCDENELVEVSTLGISSLKFEPWEKSLFLVEQNKRRFGFSFS